jgi:hypothetical protein
MVSTATFSVYPNYCTAAFNEYPNYRTAALSEYPNYCGHDIFKQF